MLPLISHSIWTMTQIAFIIIIFYFFQDQLYKNINNKPDSDKHYHELLRFNKMIWHRLNRKTDILYIHKQQQNLFFSH